MEEHKQKILMKNNKIIKARYTLNAIENKIFQLILFKFQKKNDDILLCTLNIAELEEVIKRKNDRTTKAIDEILTKLMTSEIFYKIGTKRGKSCFINNYEYDEITKEFLIYADANIYKLLFDYLKGYTPVNLAIFFSFKTYYSQRMYELLRLWSNSKHIINYTIDELKELLMLENKYAEYRDFKRRVITSSIKELNEKSLMQIEINENKVNRKVISIDFIVSDNDKRKYFEEDKNNKTIPDQQQHKTYKSKNKELKFKNFDERTYDYVDLEKKLLGWDD